jgi:hypothetical protein
MGWWSSSSGKNAYFASIRPWVQTPLPKKLKKSKNFKPLPPESKPTLFYLLVFSVHMIFNYFMEKVKPLNEISSTCNTCIKMCLCVCVYTVIYIPNAQELFLLLWGQSFNQCFESHLTQSSQVPCIFPSVFWLYIFVFLLDPLYPHLNCPFSSTHVILYGPQFSKNYIYSSPVSDFAFYSESTLIKLDSSFETLFKFLYKIFNDNMNHSSRSLLCVVQVGLELLDSSSLPITDACILGLPVYTALPSSVIIF